MTPRVPPGGAGRRAQELGQRLPDLHVAQRGRDAAAARGRQGPAARAVRLRVELVGLRRRGGDSDARGRAAAAGVAVRRDQAGGRAPLLPVLRQLRRAAVSLRYFTVYGPRQRPDMAFHRFIRRRSTASRSPCTATASRRATSRSSPTPSRRPWPPATAACPGASITSAAAAGSRSIRCSSSSAGSPAGRSTSAARPRRKGDMRDTFADTSRARAGPRVSRRRVTLEAGLPPSIEWLVETRCPDGLMTDGRSRRLAAVWPLVGADAVGRLRSKSAGAAAAGRSTRTSSCSSAAPTALNERSWLGAREYFRRLVDSYPQSTLPRRTPSSASATPTSARTAVESLILAANEFREFLTFFPTHPRADYAQYRLAIAQFKQMLEPERDQTATATPSGSCSVSVERIRTAQLIAEVAKLYREARDRLPTVGVPGRRSSTTASDGTPARSTAFKTLLKDDPEYTAATPCTSTSPNRSCAWTAGARRCLLRTLWRVRVRASSSRGPEAVAELKSTRERKAGNRGRCARR